MSQRTMEPPGHPQVTRTSPATGRRTRARGGWAPVPTGTVDGLSREQHAMERRKRRVYAVTLLAAALALGTSWLTREPGDVVLTYVYPLTGLLLVALTVAMLQRRLTLRTFEAIAYGMMAVLILGRLAWHLHLAGPIEEHLLVLVGGHYWAVGVLLVAGFVLLDRRRGLIGGVVVITTSVVLVVTGAGADLLGADGTRVELLYLARVHAFLVLLLALSMAVATVREQLHRSLARAEAFEELAATDQLTGLANRRAALEVLGRELRAQRRYGRPVTVVLADIDHFKRINDAHGHSVGDRVLCEVAAELRRHARDADVVARWGGEEFLIVAVEVDEDGAATLAERCRQAIGALQPAGLPVSATFGVAEVRDGEDLDALLQRADHHLYQGKRAGRDRVVREPGPA